MTLCVAVTVRGQDYKAMKPEEFARLPGLAEKLEPGQTDLVLLGAAIFHETNRVRQQLGLRVLRPLEPLDVAAETQAKIGAFLRPPSHTNPFPLIATPLDRVRFAGLEPSEVAENIALVTIYDAPRGADFYTLKGDPRLRDAQTGKLLEPHTIGGFARSIVEAWMNSPGHRAAMLDPRFRYLGCSASEARSPQDVDLVFGVQVFCALKPRPWRGHRAPTERR